MLQEFSCENFRNFKEKIVLDFTCANYEFNKESVRNGIVNTGVIYGINGSGKTNLGLAIMDISTVLTDNAVSPLHTNKPSYHLNDKEKNIDSFFSYKFLFDGHCVRYDYQKAIDLVVWEALYIDGEEPVIFYSHADQNGSCHLKGAENLATSLSGRDNLSYVKYIDRNGELEDNEENRLFKKFTSFVNNMLWFSSLDNNQYEGFKSGTERIAEGIISHNALQDFENRLKDIDIDYKLREEVVYGKKQIMVHFPDSDESIDFFTLASRGTASFALFYYWYLHKDEASFIFIDEFDAFYHSALSEQIIKLLKEINSQTFVTTHNTFILSNQLLRPDCYFNLQNGSIKSFSKLTNSEIRKIHNLEKLYRSGFFNG